MKPVCVTNRLPSQISGRKAVLTHPAFNVKATAARSTSMVAFVQLKLDHSIKTKPKSDKRPISPWTKFPNEVARDKRVSAGLLVFLAFHATHAGRWVNTNAKLKGAVRRTEGRGSGRGSGMGDEAIKRYRREAKALCFLQRRQPKSQQSGKYLPATESLLLPKCGESGNAGRMVCRSWFDGKHSVEELALLIYVRAGTRAGAPYLREVVDRFGWSKPTALKHLKALRDAQLIERYDHREAGRFVGHRYKMVRLDADQLAPSRVKMPDHGSPDHGLPSRLRSYTETLHELPTTLSARESPEESPIRTPQAEKGTPSGATLAEMGLGDCGLPPATPEALDEVRSLGDDDELRVLLRKAAGGGQRMARSLRTPDGIECLRNLVARLVGTATPWNFTPIGALVSVLNAIHARFGSREKGRLNSLGLVARRFSAEIQSGRLACPPYKTDGDAHFTLPPGCVLTYDELTDRDDDAITFSQDEADRALQELKALDADGARALSRTLHSHPAALRAFVLNAANANHTDVESVLAAMANVLRRTMLQDNVKPSSITSWRYFEGHVADEAQRVLAEHSGERPGDLDWRTGT